MSLDSCSSIYEVLFFWLFLASALCCFSSYWLTLKNLSDGSRMDAIGEIALGPIYFHFVSNDKLTDRGRTWRKIYAASSILLAINITTIVLTEICQ